MRGDWKPGDVAMVTGRWVWSKPHSTRRAFRDTGCWTTGTRDVMDHEVSDVRPLVVIDPEDAKQVERLADAYHSVDHRIGTTPLQAALREFATPTPPKPDEPRGLGAVVEDAEGKRWVRHAGMFALPWYRANASSRTWAEIDAVRVLSEGVTS